MDITVTGSGRVTDNGDSTFEVRCYELRTSGTCLGRFLRRWQAVNAKKLQRYPGACAIVKCIARFSLSNADEIEWRGDS